MRILFYYLITLSVPWLSYAHGSALDTIKFNFYATPIEIQYDPQMLRTNLDNEISEESFLKFCQEMSNNGYSVVLHQLFNQKQTLDLNDWLYYLLIRVSADKIFTAKTADFKTLFCWFILNKSGYDTKLNYLQNDLSLSVFTRDEVFDMPRRAEKNGWYVDITSFFKSGWQNITMSNEDSKTSRFISPIPSENDRAFQFYLQKLPKFINPTIEERTFSFIHDNQESELTIKVNKNAVRVMYRYPETTIKQQSQIPMSLEARNSLIPQLKEKVKMMSNYEAVRYILSFTRQAFTYKTDIEAYGLENVTFSPEETLYYTDSDCEDRSILFVFLVEEVLNLDAILIDFPDHASAAVNFKGMSYGKSPIVFNNANYTICDPTGPCNHLLPGDYPKGLENVSYGIIDK